MPDLKESLQGRDMSLLRIIADLWGLDIDAPDAKSAIEHLAVLLLDGKLVEECVSTLPEGARAALQDLLHNEGRLPWALFTRRHGALREMGAARRDRERPYLNVNASATEMLWYRGLVGRGFFETPAGADEFVYIPEDLQPLIPALNEMETTPMGRPASPTERAIPILANDYILDDVCSLLAALRLGIPMDSISGILHCGIHSPYPLSPNPLLVLISSAGLLDPNGLPLPEPTRIFLEARRGETLAMLVKAWLHSVDFDELRLIPSLQAEGEWWNDPLRTRQTILDFIMLAVGSSLVLKGAYLSLDSFVAAVKQAYPDYQRPAGDYDSWYLRDKNSGEYLRGFENWEAVDGTLLRFFITGPLYWLGITDLATSVEPGVGASATITAFRLSSWATDLLRGDAPRSLADDEEKLQVTSDGRLRLSVNVPRVIRYQVARFCEWDEFAEGFYRYRLTPTSLERARSQGLRVEHILTLLSHHAATVPPSLIQALKRWESLGSQAIFENVTVLRLKDPEILSKLRASRAARFLGDPLGPATVIVQTGAVDKILAALAELGYLGDKKSPE